MAISQSMLLSERISIHFICYLLSSPTIYENPSTKYQIVAAKEIFMNIIHKYNELKFCGHLYN